MEEKEIKKKINYKKLNDILKLSHKVLKVFYVLIFIVCVYVVLKICQELKVLNFILDILRILIPLFIGIIIAWLFNPFVSFLEKKGIKRVFGVIIVYILLIGIIALLVGSILPLLYDQIISFAHTIPNLVASLEDLLNSFINKFNHIDVIDIEAVKSNIIGQLDKIGKNISSSLPAYTINGIKTLFSGLSSFIIGLVIGFFLLLRSNGVGDTLIGFAPKKWRQDAYKLAETINVSLRNYVLGVIIDACVIFFICTLAFSLIGLKAPLLFAAFCAITNVIPYVGPYIGAVPALIVGFSVSPTVGILTLAAIVIIQFIEGNFLQEYIMSKTTKLHPVTIITGLLIFGYYWGILGMVVSTPIISIIKQLWLFFDDKYDFFNLRGEVSE